MEVTKPNRVSLPSAAHQLEVSYERAKRFLFTGKLDGEKVDGRWMVDDESIERLKRERKSAAASPFGSIPHADRATG